MKHLSLLSACMCVAVGHTQEIFGIFETSAVVSFEFLSSDDFTAEQLYNIETATRDHFFGLLADTSHKSFQGRNELLDVFVSVRYQSLGPNNMLIIESGIDVFHFGDRGIFDLAALLVFLVNTSTENISDHFAELQPALPDPTVRMASFENLKESDLLKQVDLSEIYLQSGKYSRSEKTLIVVTSILAIALLVLSAILLWVAGGWLILRKQVKMLLHREEELTRMTMQLKRNPTGETDDEQPSPDRENATEFTNPSGILGVNPFYERSKSALDGLGIKMSAKTPARRSPGDMDSEPMTPMSEMTTPGRAPMGIMSMRKLIPGAGDPTPGRENVKGFGMKKLEYY